MSNAEHHHNQQLHQHFHEINRKVSKGVFIFILAYQQEFSIQINFYVENFPLNNRNFPTNSTKAYFCDVPRSDPVLDGLDMNLLKQGIGPGHSQRL